LLDWQKLSTDDGASSSGDDETAHSADSESSSSDEAAPNFPTMIILEHPVKTLAEQPSPCLLSEKARGKLPLHCPLPPIEDVLEPSSPKASSKALSGYAFDSLLRNVQCPNWPSHPNEASTIAANHQVLLIVQPLCSLDVYPSLLTTEHVLSQGPKDFQEDSSGDENPNEFPQANMKGMPPKDLTDKELDTAIDKVVAESALSHQYKQELKQTLQEYRHLMAKSMKDIPGTDLVECSIDTGDHKPIFQRPFRVSQPENDAILIEINKMLDAGVIEPSKSPWASPVVMAPKPDGSWRFCVDFRKVNKITKKYHWPLTRIDDCLDSFAGSVWFSNLDLFAGYWQIRMVEKDKEKTTFICKFGTYQFKVMAFGLTNAPSLFQETMEKALADILMKFVIVYLDDVTIHSASESEHIQHIKAVFERLECAKLRIKLAKCHFGLQTLKFLGFQVDGQGVSIDPKKVSKLQEAKAPNSVSAVRSFMGLCSYLRKFIPDYSSLLKPIQDLVRVKKWGVHTWTDVHQEVFEQVKRLISTAPILAHPKEGGPYRLSCDASDVAIGGFLEREIDDLWYPVAYLSRVMSNAEKNYPVHERECLAIYWCLRKLRHLLLGCSFQLFTDNSALVYILSQVNPTGRLARWISGFLEFDFVLQHRKGKENPVADFLSRPTLVISDKSYLFEEFLRDITVYLNTGLIPDTVTISHRKFRQRAAAYVIIEHKLYIKKRTQQGFSLRRVLVGVDRIQAMVLLHDVLGHTGYNTMWPLLQSRYWWPSMAVDVKNYCRTCDSCQRFQKTHPKFSFSGEFCPKGLFYAVALDFAGPFPVSSRGNRYFLLGIEVLTRWVWAWAVPDATSATSLEFVRDHIIPMIGTPVEIWCDRGTHFTGDPFQTACVNWGIRVIPAPSYISEHNGLAERAIQSIERAMEKMTAGKFAEWDTHLSWSLLIQRVRIHSKTKTSAAQLMYGQAFRLPGDPEPVVRPVGGNMLNFREMELEKLAADRYEQYLKYGDKESREVQYKVGQKVLLLAGELRKGGHTKKLDVMYTGPYIVIYRESSKESLSCGRFSRTVD
jgi:hypothetical protein